MKNPNLAEGTLLVCIKNPENLLDVNHQPEVSTIIEGNIYNYICHYKYRSLSDNSYDHFIIKDEKRRYFIYDDFEECFMTLSDFRDKRILDVLY